MLSSIASLGPEPREKWAVWAASPSRTTLPWCQLSWRRVAKLTQSERFDISRRPRSSGWKSASQYAMLCASLADSRPARRQASSGHSTMKVQVCASKGYACTWNRPWSFRRKMKVKASSGMSLPNQTYFVGCVTTWGVKNSPYVRRARPLMPSAPTIRSAPSSSARSRISRPNSSRTPSARQRPWRMLINTLRGTPVDLLDAGDRGEQPHLTPAGVFAAADEVGDRARRGQISRRDLLCEWPGERVVVPQILCARIGCAIAEREIAHPPQAGPAGPAQVGPGGDGLGRSPGKRARRSTAVHVAIGVACHAGQRLTARPTDQ